MWTNYIHFWDDLEDPLKVTFDGERKRVYINTQYPVVRVKEDMYSASKRWLQRRQNASFPPPFRTVGGDQVGDGLFAGDLYFLTNEWQVFVSHQVAVTGVLYTDSTSLLAYNVEAGGGVVATVSSLAYAYNTTGVTVPSAGEVASAVWNTNPTPFGVNTVAGKIKTIDDNTTTIKTTTNNILATTV